MLCSDGVTDILDDVEIEEIVKANINAENCVQALLHDALNFGSRDNVTVIVCNIM